MKSTTKKHNNIISSVTRAITIVIVEHETQNTIRGGLCRYEKLFSKQNILQNQSLKLFSETNKVEVTETIKWKCSGNK